MSNTSHKFEASGEKKRKKHKPSKQEVRNDDHAAAVTESSSSPTRDLANLCKVRTIVCLSGPGKLEPKGEGKAFTLFAHDCCGYKYVIQGWDSNAILLDQLFRYDINR
jgi:hypothetical protein